MTDSVAETSHEQLIEKIKIRWEKYRETNKENPDARINELTEILKLINVNSSDIILEAGTGSGYLTKHLVGDIKPYATVISADVSAEGLAEIKNKSLASLISTYLITDDYSAIKKFPADFNQKFTKICSLATFHHFDNTEKNTGHFGRVNLLQEAFSMLKNGGELLIADVADGTATAEYFHRLNNPRYIYPLGHPHDFFNIVQLKNILEDIGFINVQIYIKDVPWIFKTESEAKHYIHNMHNAVCSVEESFSIAKEVLGFSLIENSHYEIGWQLFFLSASKPGKGL